MGLLSKAVKKIKGAAKTAVGGRTKFGRQVFKAVGNVTDKGMGALTLGQITGSDRAKLEAQRAADAQAPIDAANAKAAADAEAARVKGIETAKTDAATSLRAKMGLGGAAVADSVVAPGVVNPAVLAAQEEEKKKKAALLAAQQANIPKTTLG